MAGENISRLPRTDAQAPVKHPTSLHSRTVHHGWTASICYYTATCHLSSTAALCSAPMTSGLGHAASSPMPRSLITWDSFNSTDFNALKSAVGLTNVSAAFAWQSPAASSTLGLQHLASSGDAAGTASNLSTGTHAPGSSNGFLTGMPAAGTHMNQNGACSSGDGNGSPYGGALAAGLAAAGATADGPNTPSPPLLGDALPPLAAPPGLASALQQVLARSCKCPVLSHLQVGMALQKDMHGFSIMLHRKVWQPVLVMW